jgi:hypothetical protein
MTVRSIGRREDVDLGGETLGCFGLVDDLGEELDFWIAVVGGRPSG